MLGANAVPSIHHPKTPHLVCRAARNAAEINQANQIVIRNYTEESYWKAGEDNIRANKYLSSPARHVVVFMNGAAVAGTASVIVDSGIGLPADQFAPEVMIKLRAGNERIAEISALAIDRSYRHARSILMLLLRYIYHFSYHCLQIDRLTIVCNPKHVDFYKTIIRFESLGELKDYKYVNAPGQLLTLRLASLDSSYSFHRYLLEPIEQIQATAA